MAVPGIAPIPVRAARPMPGRGMPDLPQFYYHTNFCELLDFVADKYDEVLSAEHVAFINEFYDLPRPAQRAFCRLIGRKGRVFDTVKLDYPEIIDLPGQWDELRGAGFISAPSAKDWSEVLCSLTKPDLLCLMVDIDPALYKKSWKKADLIDVARAHLDFDTVTLPASLIVQNKQSELRFLLWLYFGKIEDNLQNFTLRDLGLVKASGFKSDYSARFDCPVEARVAYFYASAVADFRTGSEAQIAGLIDSVETWPQAKCEASQTGRDRLLRKLGGLSERLGDIDTALNLYGRSDNPLCNERSVRLRWKRNDGDDRDWVKARLEALIDDPGSDDELHFAQDFYARKFDKKRTGVGQICCADRKF